MFKYDELEAQVLIEAFQKNGVVQIELDTKRARVCKKLLSIMDQSLGPMKLRASGIHKFKQLIYALLFSPYVLMFHSGLGELVVLYSKVTPVWSYESIAEDKHIFTFNKREWGK